RFSYRIFWRDCFLAARLGRTFGQPRGLGYGRLLSVRLTMSSTASEYAHESNSSTGLRTASLLYTAAILAVIVATFLVSLRRDGFFACPSNGYGGNYYLGYCQGRTYGDYDHGAFWFGLDSTARESAALADVLFIGNSRMQFGFSAPPLGRWFAANGQHYYLLGFSHVENATFIGPLLRS